MLKYRLAIIIAFCASAPLLAQGTVAALQKTLEKPHQLRDSFIEFQLRGWPVTFEEGPILDPAGLVHKTSPTGLPIIVKRTAPLRLNVSAEELNTTSKEARMTVIRNILAAYARVGNRDSYAVVRLGAYFQVIPERVPVPSGDMETVDPILNTPISFPAQRFSSLIEFLELVLNSVAQKRDVALVLGDMPTNLFRRYSLMEFAQDEPARKVLERGFGEINGPRLAEGLNAIALPWTLTYDATGSQYWFNVNAIGLQTTGVAGRALPASNAAEQPPNRAAHVAPKKQDVLP